MRVKDAQRADFPACLRLLTQIWPQQPFDGADLARLRGLLTRLVASPDARMLVMEEAGEVVGLADVTFRTALFHRGRVMIIEDLVVDRARRGRGIGRALVEAAEDLAAERGCVATELCSDLPRREAHAFWEALGFERLAYQFRRPLVVPPGRPGGRRRGARNER